MPVATLRWRLWTRAVGVSDRQARNYVKELERAGLIAAEQRGLRRTNAYFFLWTAELEKLSHSVPEDSDGPGESPPQKTVFRRA
jgi:hypothetical protein